ncbi:hypothetical protein HK096_001329 [Nowakowskiella sp. JEL0078]|nr:hypothetical protein HK096_001329 [Nowakowskiella sp. JEL0078]
MGFTSPYLFSQYSLPQLQYLYNQQTIIDAICNSQNQLFQYQAPALLPTSLTSISSLSNSSPTILGSALAIDHPQLMFSEQMTTPTESEFSFETLYQPHNLADMIMEVESGGMINADGTAQDLPVLEQSLSIDTSDLGYVAGLNSEGYDFSSALSYSSSPQTCKMDQIYAENHICSTPNKAGLVFTSPSPNDFGSDFNIQTCSFNYPDSTTTCNESGTPSSDSTVYSLDEDTDECYSENDSHELSYFDKSYKNRTIEIRAPTQVARISKSTSADPSVDMSHKWVCKERGCSKVYSGRSGLRYHREKVHDFHGPLPQNLTPIAFRNGNNNGGANKDLYIKRTTRPTFHSRSNSADTAVAEMMKDKLDINDEARRERNPGGGEDPLDITVVSPAKFKPGKWVCGVYGCTKVYNGRSGLRYHRQRIHEFLGTVPNTLYCPPNTA